MTFLAHYANSDAITRKPHMRGFRRPFRRYRYHSLLNLIGKKLYQSVNMFLCFCTPIKMEDSFWTTLALSFEVFFLVYVLTMEEDERMNGARQSRIASSRTEKRSLLKNEYLVSVRERRRKRRRRMRLRIEKLQGSQEVNDYLTNESNLYSSSGDESKTLPEVPVLEIPVPPPGGGEEWDTVSHPSSPTPRGSRFWFWKYSSRD
jgi:hypothetical protein